MTDRELMQQALEALETLMIERGSVYHKAITALRERLAQPVPVAFKDAPERIYLQVCEDDHCEVPFHEHDEKTWCTTKQNPLDVPYVRADLAASPQRKPLSEEEITNIFADVLQSGTFLDVARAIERAHGIGGKDE